jgi:hypothetical protein
MDRSSKSQGISPRKKPLVEMTQLLSDVSMQVAGGQNHGGFVAKPGNRPLPTP